MIYRNSRDRVNQDQPHTEIANIPVKRSVQDEQLFAPINPVSTGMLHVS
ncbi:hypothetical protein [Bdellovibrio sp.]